MGPFQVPNLISSHFPTAIDKISCALEDLLRQAENQNNKLDDMSHSLESLSVGFASLGKDVKKLSSLSSDKLDSASEEGECIESHKGDTHDSLESISDTLDECKTALENIESFTHPCGGGGWWPVANFDFTDASVLCPAGWEEVTFTEGPTTVRGCGRINTGQMTIDTATFPPTGNLPSYNRVCGRINAFASGGPDAFINDPRTIEEVYVDGVSLTHGSGTERTHIWTFVAAAIDDPSMANSQFACPCDGGQGPPAFVGSDYFCEAGAGDVTPIPSGPQLNDLLWDGLMCTTESCCTFNTPPYFTTYLDDPTTDPIDARILFEDSRVQDNIAITKMELFVQMVPTSP